MACIAPPRTQTLPRDICPPYTPSATATLPKNGKNYQVEGRNLLKQRNALQRVTTTASAARQGNGSSSRVSSCSPDNSPPLLTRSAKRRSFKASFFRIITPNSRNSSSMDELDAPRPGSSGLTRVNSLPSVSVLSATQTTTTTLQTQRLPPGTEDDKKTLKKSKKEKERNKEKEKERIQKEKQEKEKQKLKEKEEKKAKEEKEKDEKKAREEKAKEKAKEERAKEREKEEKEKEKDRKTLLPLWAAKRASVEPSTPAVSVCSPAEDGARSQLLVASVCTPPTPGTSGHKSVNGIDGKTPSPRNPPVPPSTLNRMKETPMGLGLGEASPPAKPAKKPKPTLPKAAIAKPPTAAKPKVAGPRPAITRSQSTSHTNSRSVATTVAFGRAALSRQNGQFSSTDSEPSRETTPSPDPFSEGSRSIGVPPTNHSTSQSASSSTSVFATTGEATSASEVGGGDRDKVSVCPEIEGEAGPMLYQTWQFVSTSSENGADTSSEVETPTSPVRPQIARKPAFGEEQLQRMHTSMRRSTRRHDKKKMRWEEQPKVRSSQVIPEMTKEEQQLQQRYFEVVSSERSYNQSMKVLVSHFMESEALSPGAGRVIEASTRHSLFSNAKALLEVSDRFLADLEERLQESIVISTVCDTIKQHVDSHFEPYVLYCSNQAYQIKTLETLLQTDAAARKAISELERSKEAQKLPLLSFLLLPMQRVTRLKLLVEAILKLVQYGTGLYALTQETLASVKTCVGRCNEGAKAMKRTEELIELNNQVDFGKLKPLALVSHKSSRWLLRSGGVTLINTEKRNKTSEVHLIVLNDMLLIAKHSRKRPMYKIIDYCHSPFLAVDEHATVDDLAPPAGSMFRSASDSVLFKLSVNSSSTESATPPENRYMKLTMLENSLRQAKTYMLEAHSMSEKTRWLEALVPKSGEDGDERIYEAWDCPEVIAQHQYIAQQPDELSMELGEVITVLKKMKDGWYQGQSQRTNDQGWFPAGYVKERETAHSRARSLRHQHMMTKQRTPTQQAGFSPMDASGIATADD